MLLNVRHGGLNVAALIVVIYIDTCTCSIILFNDSLYLQTHFRQIQRSFLKVREHSLNLIAAAIVYS